MKYSLVFHRDVENDIHDSFTWYEGHRSGLGNDFILSLEATLENIRRNPERFPNSVENTKKALVFRFPFVIIYQILESKILVIAVLHSSRNPQNYKERID